MSDYNFLQPSRQSAKGIIVIFGYSLYKVIKATIIVILAFFVKYFQSDKSGFFTSPKVFLFVGAFLVFFLILSVLKYLNFKFYLSDSAFVLRKGIVTKEEISINKTKIQNVYIKQNLLQQIINVVSLSIETAGDDKTEIEIKALEKSKALALKAELLRFENNTATTEKITELTNTIFFKASIKQLLLEGISENHIKSFLLISAFIMGIYSDLKDVLKQLKISSRFNKLFQLDEQSLMSILFFNLSVVLILIVFSFLFSLIRTVIQNFDLIVIRKPDGFEISKGLFNKLSLSLKTSRIQTVTIATNRFKKALGLFQLVFTQAMINKKQRQKFKIVGLKKEKIDALITELFPKVFDNFIKNKPNKYIIYRVFYICIIPITLLNIVFYYATPIYFVLNIPIILVVILNAIYRYKKMYFGIDDNYMVVCGGNFINTITTIAEINKIQAVTYSQTIFQKHRNLASIHFFTAGKALKIPHVNVEKAKNIKNYLLFKVESSAKDWM